MGLFLLKLLRTRSHFDRVSESSCSAVNFWKSSKIEMNYDMIYEKVATPTKRMKVMITLSISLFGLKSPKPTVDSVVNMKYTTIVRFSQLVFSPI